MKLKIKNKREIAADTLEVSFDIEGKDINYKPGQYFFIKLPDAPYDDEKGLTRHFSIVSSPNENVITMATRLRGSGFKKSLKEMSVSSEVEIYDIQGEFVLPENPERPLVFLAGGIGITPFMSMLRYMDGKDIDHPVTLIYSNRTKESTAYLEELKELAEKRDNFTLILTMTDDADWDGETRIIDAQFLKDCIDDYKNHNYYIAGPPGMVEAMEEHLSDIEVDNDNIVKEEFGGY